jgi:hypothetical protein
MGISSLPNWPASFIKRQAALDLLYVVETLDYSISYSPMDALYSNSASSAYKIAALINQYNKPILPTLSTMQLALSDIGDFKRGNFISVTDSSVENAYPLTLLTFILVREHYYYNGNVSMADNCKRVEYMVDFWMSTLKDREFTQSAVVHGWIPLTGKLLENSIKALSLVTCMKKSVIMTINENTARITFFSGFFPL